MYMSEIAPTCWRGRVVGLSASGGSIGGIVISLVLLGSSYVSSSWSWRTPLLVQIVAPLIVAILVYPLNPESPRYLVAKGKVDKARKVLAQYHTSSEDMHHPLVNAEIEQIEQSLTRIEAKTWDWSPLWKTKTDRRRLFIIFLYSMFQQWNGSNLFSYYLPAVLSTIGITGSHQQLGINLGQVAIGWVSTLIGASLFFDRIRRRTLLLFAMAMFVMFLVLITICSARFEISGAKALGYVIILWIYLFDLLNGLTGEPSALLQSSNATDRDHSDSHAFRLSQRGSALQAEGQGNGDVLLVPGHFRHCLDVWCVGRHSQDRLEGMHILVLCSSQIR